jgi:ABC-2 type transport system permease protein
VSDVGLVLKQTAFLCRSTSRDPRAMVFTVAFPIVLLVLFSSIFASGSGGEIAFGGGRIATDAYFTAGILAYAIMLSAFTTPLISVTTQRERGQLKRLRGTPMPAWTFIAAQILRSIALMVLMTVVMLAIGRVAFGVEVRDEGYLGLVVYLLLGTAAMAGPALALTSFMKTSDSASSVGPFAAVMLSFISGVFIPVDELPSWLEEIGGIFPLAPLAEGLQATVATGSGTGLSEDNVAVLAIWALVGVVVAARNFRWEPQAY